jgi:hypothetical protein
VRKKRGSKKGKGAVVEQLRAESHGSTTSRPLSLGGAAVSAFGSVQQDLSNHEQWQDGTEMSHQENTTPSSALGYSPHAGTHTSAVSAFSNHAYTSASTEVFAQAQANTSARRRLFYVRRVCSSHTWLVSSRTASSTCSCSTDKQLSCTISRSTFQPKLGHYTSDTNAKYLFRTEQYY